MQSTFATVNKDRFRRLARPNRSASLPGFTLVEMLVVLTIIGLIAGLVGPRVIGYVGDSRAQSAELQITAFESALDLFYIDVGRYPSNSEGLQALVSRPGTAQTWNGPYLREGEVPKDPWGGDYQYQTAGPGGPVAIEPSEQQTN